MQVHAIVEFEEGALNVVVGGRDGKQLRVLRSVRVPLVDTGREALSVALRGIGSDLLHGATGVHVVLGDRRALHFASTLPPLGSTAAMQYVVREAARLGGLPAGADLLINSRLLRRLRDGKLVVGSAVLPRAAWTPLAQALEESGLPVLGLYTMESCLARAAGNGAAASAIVETNAGRARFVACDGDCPVQVRRFLVGGGEGNGHAMATQLAMELPRTFEWLRETGHAVPKTLVLGLRVAIDDDGLSMLQNDELPQVVRARSQLVVDEGQVPPGLAASELLTRLLTGRETPSLLEPPRLLLPIGKGRKLALLTMVAAGLCASVFAVDVGMELWQLRQQVQGLAEQQAVLEADVVPDPGPVPMAEGPLDARLQAVLTRRRPISLLLADISGIAQPELHVEDLRFGSNDRLLVAGVVQGKSRQQALAAIAAFGKRLDEIPYLRTGGDEEIVEVPRLPNSYRFRLGMTWRNP